MISVKDFDEGALTDLLDFNSGISSIGFSSVIYALGGLGYLILLPERLDRTAGTSEMGLSSNIATGAILVLCFDLIDLVDF